MTWHIITGEYPPTIGGVSDYSQLVAEGLADAGDEVHVWCPPRAHVPASNRVTVHPALGHLSRRDLRAVDRLLDQFPAPRRLLVQWVPQSFGYRSMNLGFCLWLLRRARRGDRIEIMVHEAYIGFGSAAIWWNAAASVQRVMTMILARAASRVWMAIPFWERQWRAYALGRKVPYTWLPIPSGLRPPAPDEVQRVRAGYAGTGVPLVGHLGTYGAAATRVLSSSVHGILRGAPNAVVLLLGQKSERFHRQFAGDHPTLATRLHAAGTLSPQALANHVGACDLLIQPYPDGISSRRTSAMAGLALGIPVITTTGTLTESLWAETRAVSLVGVDDSHALTAEALRLLADDRARRDLGARGHDAYRQHFDLRHTIGALRRAAQEPCASPS